LATLDLAKFYDEFGRERDLGLVSDDEPRAVLEEDVHLALAWVLDFNFDEGGVRHGPWFCFCRSCHSRRMAGTPSANQIRQEAVFPPLTHLHSLPIS
jgi:hypothetical protein